MPLSPFSHKRHKRIRQLEFTFLMLCKPACGPIGLLNQRLLLYRFDVGHQRLGLVFGYAFLFVTGHIGWLLCLLSLEDNLNEVCVS